MNRFVHIRAVLAVLVTAGCFMAVIVAGTRPMPARIVVRTVTQTRTITRPPAVVYRTTTIRVDVPVPGPTVTASSSGQQVCITALYQQLSFDAANGSVLPHGWWDTQCEPYTP